MDLTGIAPGMDFGVRIEEAIGSSHVFIALIGNRWLDIADPDGRRRLDDPADPVRLEIASALRRSDLVVIPVLVPGATMPRAEQLPDDLKPLSRRNAHVLTDERWRANVDELIQFAESVLSSRSQGQPHRTERTGHGAAGGTVPAGHVTGGAAADLVGTTARESYLGWLPALVVVGLVVAGLITFVGPKIFGAITGSENGVERLTRSVQNSVRGLTLNVVSVKQTGSTTRVGLAARNNTEDTLSLPVFGNCILSSANGETLKADPHASTWADDLPPGGDLQRGTVVFEGTLPDAATRASLSFTTIYGQGFSRPKQIKVSGIRLRRP